MIAIPTAQLARDYAAGASLNELTRRYPICRTAILYRLKRFGVQLRRTGAPYGNQNARGSGPPFDDPLPDPGPDGPGVPGDERP